MKIIISKVTMIVWWQWWQQWYRISSSNNHANDKALERFTKSQEDPQKNKQKRIDAITKKMRHLNIDSFGNNPD